MYVVEVTSSDWVTAVARWFLVLSIVTAAVVISVRVPAHLGWWSLHATSAQMVAVATIGCVAVAGVRLLMRRHTRSVGATQHGIESACPSAGTAPQAQTSVASFPTGPNDPSMPYEWGGAGTSHVPIQSGHIEATDPEAAITGTESASSELAVSMESSSIEDRDTGPNPGLRPGDLTRSSTEFSSSNHVSDGMSADVAGHPSVHRPEAESGDDALRLTEVLNLYERIGFLPDGRGGEANVRQDSVDDLPPQHGLWDELVRGYGAASVEFGLVGSGGCVITLHSGDMVFYDPHSGRWAWVVFDRAGTTSDLDAPTAPVRSVDGAEG